MGSTEGDMAGQQRRTFGQMNLAIFRGEDPGGVAWHAAGTVP